MNARPALQEQDNTVHALFEVMQELATELHTYKTRTAALNLDSSLDADLGLDSLTRVELISRIEQHFNIILPQRVFTDAESPRDLLRAITSVQGKKEVYPPAQVTEFTTGRVEELPRNATTLIEVLKWHVQRHPERLHIRVLGDEDEQVTLSYGQLWQGAKKVAAGLQQQGIQPEEAVAIMLPTCSDYFLSFFGILLTGAIPVPIYPPVRRSQLEDHLRRHTGILNNCLATMLITVPEAKVVARLLKSQVESLRHIVTAADLTSQKSTYSRPVIGTYDIALLQYTSGSTGNPKGVVLTHANLLANIRVMGEAVKADSSDVFVSWLPLYHDMGLIGAWLGSLYFAIALVVMSPLSFLVRPQRWFWAINQYQGTLSASPNFGYELCLKRISDHDMKGLDLSSWRLAFNGAEPVSPDTIKRFTERFQSAGFRPEAMMPVYGLAESSVGLAFPPLYQKPLIDCVQRESFTRSREAIPAEHSDKNALCFVGCGPPLPAHEVRILDAKGRELPDRHEGSLQFRGPSVTTSYYRNLDATRDLFDQDWLNSGDLAYIAEGNIFITDRSKDVIIRAGRNIYPHEVEEIVGNIPGIRKGCVVAFGATEPGSGTERLVILAETRETDTEKKAQLQNKITVTANDLMGFPPDDVVLASPHTVLKTSSGKVRRSACRDLYEQGQLGQAYKALWLQLTRTVLRSLLPEWRRMRRQLINSLYASYVWALFGILSSIAWLSAMALPRLSWRWSVIQGLSRVLALASRTTITVNGLQKLLPANQPCVYVSNHASYLDSLALTAAIPHIFSFVAKAELREKFFARLLLQRLHVEFVERFDKQKSVIDAQRIAKAMQRKKSLFFFPEGTFMRASGLMNFYMGAFVTAAQMNVPVVPIAIRGTRSMLRSDSWFPRRGHITITVGEAIDPDKLPEIEKQDKWRVALALRDAARKHILHYCGEPDLSHELPPI
ncbi:MAG: AMP-binding protein [Gammaproteobacteria bacterium]|nr:MAG: AMP-binding protein [Gammaproteobacteria bacterium]